MNEIKTVSAEQFRSAVFFSLSISRWGNRAKVKDQGRLAEYLALLNQKDGEEITVRAVEGGGTAATKTTKVLIRSEPLDKLNEFLNKTKADLCGPFGKANPSRIREGLFVVAKPLVQEFEDKLAAALKELKEKYLPPVLEDYLPAKERAKNTKVKEGGLGPIYDERDYPLSSELAEMYGFSWQWLALGVPDDLPAALRAQAAEKLEKQFTEAAEEVKDALRISFQKLIEHAVSCLKPGDDGKQRVFRNSMLENIQSFIDVFSARNIMNDTELGALVNKAQDVLIGVPAIDALRKDANARETTLKAFEEVKAILEPLVESKKSRRFNFEE